MRTIDREFDTVVVPAREEGFRRVFLGEQRWYPIRLSPGSRARLRYVAAYRTAPLCAVTHVGSIRGFSALGDGRWAIELEDVREVGPIPFIYDGATKTIQTPRLTKLDRLLSVASLNQLLKEEFPATALAYIARK